jgi:hypothetical protein
MRTWSFSENSTTWTKKTIRQRSKMLLEKVGLTEDAKRLTANTVEA